MTWNLRNSDINSSAGTGIKAEQGWTLSARKVAIEVHSSGTFSHLKRLVLWDPEPVRIPAHRQTVEPDPEFCLAQMMADGSSFESLGLQYLRVLVDDYECQICYYACTWPVTFWSWNSTVLTDLQHLYRIYSNPTHDKHQWLLLQFIVLLMMDAKDVRNM